jgi:hypothetical protein
MASRLGFPSAHIFFHTFLSSSGHSFAQQNNQDGPKGLDQEEGTCTRHSHPVHSLGGKYQGSKGWLEEWDELDRTPASQCPKMQNLDCAVDRAAGKCKKFYTENWVPTAPRALRTPAYSHGSCSFFSMQMQFCPMPPAVY